MFLRKASIEPVAQAFKEANVSYSIIIDNYQKQIDDENPTPEEIESFQDRNGMFVTNKFKHYVLYYLGPHIIT